MTDINRTLVGVQNTDRGPWMGTYCKGRFYPFSPNPDEIVIEDIARSLSLQCRYNGHISRMYSVAEHSYYVSKLASPENKLWGLLHDATEAYIGDMIRPIKGRFQEFIELEDEIHKTISKKFGLTEKIPEEVHYLDNVVCSTEKRDLLPGTEPWVGMPEPSAQLLIPSKDYGWKYYEDLFLETFKSLTK